LIVLERKLNAIPVKEVKIENSDELLINFFANYLQSISKLLNGESRTRQPI